VLLDNRWQASKARWLTWGFMLWTLGFMYWAWLLAQTYGLSPGDGGVLRPLHERLTVAGVVALTGLLPTGGMWLYSRRYLLRIERDADMVALTTLGMLHPNTRVFRVSDLSGAGYHQGRTPGPRGYNPHWMTLRVAGLRLPFIADLQAEHIDTAAITAMISSARTQSSRRERRRTNQPDRA
jgi:hypothetical protein